MRRLLLLLLLMPIVLFSQNKKDVSLKVDNIVFKGDTVLLTMNLINGSNDTITFYKASLKDICTSVLKIYAKDSKGNKYEVFPCKAIIDLESIYLDYSNTVTLAHNEGFQKIIKFSIKDFAPYLIKGNYELFVELNYSIANFETRFNNVFHSDILSKKYDFKF